MENGALTYRELTEFTGPPKYTFEAKVNGKRMKGRYFPDDKIQQLIESECQESRDVLMWILHAIRLCATKLSAA
jgi:hypothetical protein